MTLAAAKSGLIKGIVAVSIGFASLAGAQDNVISSDRPGALPPPRAWDCDFLIPEYDAWIEAGNSPDTWRFVGKNYRDVADSSNYDWNDWLEWRGRSCPALGTTDGGLGSNAALIGGIVGALGLTALAAGSGGGNGGADSPG